MACKVLMKVFYAARVARFDLYRPVARLARYLTKWTTTCDKKLYRLMCYIKSTLHYRMVGWCGDDLGSIDIHAYADANLGTDGGKSTSGVQLQIEGPNTCFPISAVSVAQQAVSHSTAEAEMVAFSYLLRRVALPALTFWQTLKPGDEASRALAPARGQGSTEWQGTYEEAIGCPAQSPADHFIPNHKPQTHDPNNNPTNQCPLHAITTQTTHGVLCSLGHGREG